ncbi:MAG: ferritin-like domain-containing protein [Longimicrobiaceae bacterium]
MNKIIRQIDNLGTLDLERLGSRRDALRGAGKWGAGVVAASVPAFLAAAAKKARAQRILANHNATPQDVLEFALTLEYLEAEFYVQGVDSGVIAGEDDAIFVTIRDHEVAHVRFLEEALGLSEDEAKPNFDFTGGDGSGAGPFDPFNDYEDFLALAQAFEDTGVRAYKGGAPVLIDDDATLAAALSIHSVEARHASEVRRLRGYRFGAPELAPQKGWITGNDRGTNMPQETQPVYDAGTNPDVYPAEDNVIQGGVNVMTAAGVSSSAATESFDEPLDIDAVLAIVDPFIEGDQTA